MAKEHVDVRSWKCPEKHQGLGGLTGFLLKVGRAMGHHWGHVGPEGGLSAKLISRTVTTPDHGELSSTGSIHEFGCIRIKNFGLKNTSERPEVSQSRRRLGSGRAHVQIM